MTLANSNDLKHSPGWQSGRPAIQAASAMSLSSAAGHSPAAAGDSTRGDATRRARRVLIIEDNADAAETLGALLEMHGQHSRIAANGETGVAEALAFQPEVIFMDIGLPGISGIEATRRIRAMRTPVRPFVVALSAWARPSDRRATRAAGCDMHLAKPATVAELLGALQCADESA